MCSHMGSSLFPTHMCLISCRPQTICGLMWPILAIYASIFYTFTNFSAVDGLAEFWPKFPLPQCSREFSSCRTKCCLIIQKQTLARWPQNFVRLHSGWQGTLPECSAKSWPSPRMWQQQQPGDIGTFIIFGRLWPGPRRRHQATAAVAVQAAAAVAATARQLLVTCHVACSTSRAGACGG